MKRLLLAVLLAAPLALPQQIRINAGRTIEGAINYCADAGASDTYACSIATAPTAYVTGAIYFFSANTANTGAATINFNSLGAKTIKKNGGTGATDLADNDIKVGQLVMVQYDGTNMQMQSTSGNAGGGGGSAFSAITASTNTTAAMVVGTGASLATSGTGTVTATSLVDSAQLSAMLVSATASSVNQITIKNAATTTAPQIQATGTDTNIGLTLLPKGTSPVTVSVNQTADLPALIVTNPNVGGGSRAAINFVSDTSSMTIGQFSAAAGVGWSGKGIIMATGDLILAGTSGSSDSGTGNIDFQPGGSFNTTAVLGRFDGTNFRFALGSTTDIGWSSATTANNGSIDTGVGRNAAGVTEVTNGTAAAYRELKLRSMIVGGTAPTITGTCSANTATGGATAGTVTSQSTSACTVILTFAFTAPTGWFCTASNRTTSANAITQTASSTTTCTLSGTTVTGDVIGYHGVAY